MGGFADLTGRVAIVTGASSGIGAAIAERFGRERMRVALAARRIALLEEVAGRVHAAGGEVLAVPTDVRDLQAITQLADRTRAAWGRIDVLVANAGISGGSVLRSSDDEIVDLFATNLLGVIRSARAVLPAMLAQGDGHIVVIASLAGKVMVPATVYGITKAGVLAFCDSLRRAVAASGLRVTAVLPAWVATPMAERARPRRVIPPGVVADAVVRLLHRPQAEVVVPAFYRWGLALNRLFPFLADAALPLVVRRAERDSRRRRPPR